MALRWCSRFQRFDLRVVRLLTSSRPNGNEGSGFRRRRAEKGTRECSSDADGREFSDYGVEIASWVGMVKVFWARRTKVVEKEWTKVKGGSHCMAEEREATVLGAGRRAVKRRRAGRGSATRLGGRVAWEVGG